MRAVLLTAALALALAGCADGGVIAPLSRSRGTENPARYVDAAAASALFESQSAQLAVTRAQRPEVRAYAQELVKRSALGTARLTEMAAAAGVTPPAAALTGSQQRLLGQLERAPAEEFDEVYLRQQLSAQQGAIRLHEPFALAGDAPLLRPVAASEVAKAYQFYQEVRRLRRSEV